jgi:hypothetical protein
MMFLRVLPMIAGHRALRHLRRRCRRRLRGVRSLHRAAVQSKRQHENNGEHSSLQAHSHGKSRAKSQLIVYRVFQCSIKELMLKLFES